MAVGNCRRNMTEPDIDVRRKRSQARCDGRQGLEESPHGDSISFIALGVRRSLLQDGNDVAQLVERRDIGGVRTRSAPFRAGAPGAFQTIEQALEPGDALRKIG